MISWLSSSFNVNILSSLEISLPIVNDRIATDDTSKFMQIKSKPLIEFENRSVVGRGGLLIDLSAIERYMLIQTKLTIAV